MAAKSDLSDDIKLFIVEHLACFDSPSVVVVEVEKEFGRKIARQTVEAYDPTKVHRAAAHAQSDGLRDHGR